MAKVAYAKSLRKQLVWVAILIFGVLLFGVAFRPVDTFEKFAVFALFLIVFAVAVLINIRLLAKAAVCPECGVDLYQIIWTARVGRITIKHCPACGAAIEV